MIKEIDLQKAEQINRLRKQLMAALRCIEQEGVCKQVPVRIGSFELNGPVGGHGNVPLEDIRNFLELVLTKTNGALRNLGVDLRDG